MRLDPADITSTLSDRAFRAIVGFLARFGTDSGLVPLHLGPVTMTKWKDVQRSAAPTLRSRVQSKMALFRTLCISEIFMEKLFYPGEYYVIRGSLQRYIHFCGTVV